MCALVTGVQTCGLPIFLSECRRNVFENAGGVEAFDALINRTERIDRIIVQEIVEFSARFHRIDVRAKKLFDVGLGHLESSLFYFVEFLLQFREFFVLLLKIDHSLEKLDRKSTRLNSSHKCAFRMTLS